MKKLKSEIGAKAAWDGFSSQTIYIASRLLNETEKLDFYPESIEDLMLKDENEIIELIQVKNYKSDLSLSDFKPQDEDSFLKRVLKYRSDKLIAKVISFGNIGEELKGALNKETRYIRSISKKLSDYGYNSEDVEWILQHLIIEKVNEKELKEKIYEKLKDNFSISTSISVFFSYLISYINTLSRNSEKTNKETWDKIVYNIIDSLVSIDSIHKQFGKTLFSLSSFTTNKSIEEQEEEYKNGFDAKPYYIKNNLDIYRKKWISAIEESFKYNDVVLIRGLSGQGKSSIAYRYLLDNYNENSIFIVKNLSDFKEAKDIISVLEGLSINSYCESILYLDVKPYDKSWKIILDHVKDKDTKIKILITIREEDYKRSNISSNLYDYAEIELTLEKGEAEEIYNTYDSEYFVNFEDAWKKFGEQGPFMEFIYLLSKNEMLVEKLENQIDNIIENEENSDEWLRFLLIVSLAGKENFSVNSSKVMEIINSKNFSKMLKNTQKEYLIKVDEESNHILSTHALRASIIVKIIYSKITINKEDIILNTLECVNDFFPSLVIEHIKDNNISVENTIDRIDEFDNLSWSTYASFVRAMLWVDVYNLYIENKENINTYNQTLGGDFILLFLVDITDLTGFDRKDHIEKLKKSFSKDFSKKIDEINFENFVLDYNYTDKLLKKINGKILNKKIQKEDNYSYVGYTLFWMKNRNITIKELTIESIDYSKIEEIEDLMIGLKAQNMDNDYEEILNIIKKEQITKNNIVYIKEDKEMSVKIINDIFEKSDRSNFEKVMNTAHSLRKTYYNKKQYNIELIGAKLIDNIEVLDNKKNLKDRVMPLSWVTELNSQFLNMNDYNNSIENWEEYKKYLDIECELIYKYITEYIKALDYFYRKSNHKKLISDSFYKMRIDIIDNFKKINKLPKCTLNAFGIENNLYSLRKMQNTSEPENQSTCIAKKLNKFINVIDNFFIQNSKAIVSKIRKENNKIENISMCNIIESGKAYIDFMKEYKKHFSNNKLIDKIYDELKTLILFWTSFINQPFINNNSKLYQTRETRKKIDEETNAFIKENLDKYKFVDNGNTIYKIEIGNIINFFESIYNKFSGKNVLSYESYLLYELDAYNDYNILYTIDGKNTFIGAKFTLNYVQNCKSLEEYIQKSITPTDYSNTTFNNIDTIEEDNLEYNYFIAAAKINSLKIYTNHILSVNSNLDEISEECLEVYNTWKKITSTALKEEIEDLISKCINISKIVNIDEFSQTMNLFIDMLEKVKAESEIIVGIKEEINMISVESIKDCFLSLMN